MGREAAIGAIPFPGGGAAAAGREAAEQVGREALEAGTREAVEAAARSAGERELGAVGREAVESAGDRAAQEAAEWCHGAACFAAGTGVLMADGTVRPIEDVAAGDRVAACDPITGEALARTVTATASHDDVPVLRVRTDDGGAVETTATHPFWVEDRGWTPAGRLRAGDRLLTPDGRTVEVTAAAPTGRTRRGVQSRGRRPPGLLRARRHRLHRRPQRMLRTRTTTPTTRTTTQRRQRRLVSEVRYNRRDTSTG